MARRSSSQAPSRPAHRPKLRSTCSDDERALTTLARLSLARLRPQVSYVLHSSVAHRLPPSPVVDYVLTVVPLLVGITLASAQPVLWLGFLLLTALLFGQRPPRSQRPLDENRRRRKIREDDSSSDDGDEAAAEGPVGEKASSARLAAQRCVSSPSPTLLAAPLADAMPSLW